ncbi:MAG TPA: hypothetical protein VIH93_02980 [Thermoanaerobaculia bacterium]|jgi:hypothetical protein
MKNRFALAAVCLIVFAVAAPLLAVTAPAVASSAASASAPVWLTQFLPTGTCTTYCSNGSGFTTVNWQTTQSQCCSGTQNFCPAGYTPRAASFLPSAPGSHAVFCPLN